MTMQRPLYSISVPSRLTRNAVFYGRGYQSTVARQDLPRTLVVPLEVKKVFMDETTGEPFPEMIDAMRGGFRTLIGAASEIFVRDHCAR